MFFNGGIKSLLLLARIEKSSDSGVWLQNNCRCNHTPEFEDFPILASNNNDFIPPLKNIFYSAITKYCLFFSRSSWIHRYWQISIPVWGKRLVIVVLWYSGYDYSIASLITAWTQALFRFKSCSWHVGDLWWCESLTMVPTWNKV